MPHFGKFAVALAATILTSGCAPKRGTASPEDYYSSARLSLEGGRVAAMIGRNQFLAEKNFTGCVASDVLASALASGEDVLRGKITDAPVIPAFDLDLTDCLALRGDDAALPSEEEVSTLVESIAGVALIGARAYGVKLKVTDCSKGVVVLAVSDYVAGMVAPLVAELAEPDGKLSMDAVAIDLASCKAP